MPHRDEFQNNFLSPHVSTFLQIHTGHLPLQLVVSCGTILFVKTWQDEILDRHSCRCRVETFPRVFVLVNLSDGVNAKQMYFDSVSESGRGADSRGRR